MHDDDQAAEVDQQIKQIDEEGNDVQEDMEEAEIKEEQQPPNLMTAP